MCALQPALTGAERNESLAQRVHRCWLRLGGAALCGDERELADARAFFAALDAHPQPARLVGEAADQLTDELYAAPEADQCSVAVMTMHAAKGLEWDVVIVPALGRIRRADSSELLNAIELTRPEGECDLLMSPIVAADASDPLRLTRYIRRLRQQRSRLERDRLLYVAATRAKRQLHWLGTAKRSGAGALYADSRSLLSSLWPAVCQDFESQLGGAATVAPVPAAIAPPLAVVGVRRRRLMAGWLRPESPLPVVRLPLPVHQPGDEVEYRWVGHTARAVGTIVHTELQRYTRQATAASDSGLLLPQQRYQEWLAELGVAADARAGAVSQIVQALQSTLQDPRGRWLLDDAQHRAAWSEYALTGMHDGEIVNIIIDRMLIDRAGQRWVVDYKTSTHEGGDREGFVLQQLERHGPQLRRYATMAARLGAEPVRCAIYFPLLGEWREL
jgi:ATP-dependent exoDNAse (exonuclease V) beta subunit